MTRPAARDLTNLRAAWRAERLAEERADCIPAIGTAEWHEQYVDTAPTPAIFFMERGENDERRSA